MNNMRAIITRALVALSVALCAIVVVPDLTFAASNCNLKRYLVTANLTGADLTNADLTGANLDRANFTDADLSGAVRRPGISRADMKGADGLETVKGLID
jgi:hypothetical protein